MAYISTKDYRRFVPENIIFEQARQLKGEAGQTFHRIVIKYNYGEVIAPLVVQTPVLFSYGISTGSQTFAKENAAPQLSLVCHSPDSEPNPEEKMFISICDKVLARIKQHLGEDSVKEELDKWDMDADVKAMKVFYIKREKGKPIKGYPPTLYAKLYYKYRPDGELEIESRIDDAMTGQPLPRRPLLGRSKVFATVIFSNVYVGAKPSVQTRIGEVMVVEQCERSQFLKPLSMMHDEEEEEAPPVVKLKTLSRRAK